MLELTKTFNVEEIPNSVFNVIQINSIMEKYKALRNKSKGPTFALTFQGTWKTLVKNIGFSDDEAKEIEANYHNLYQVSDAWVQTQIRKAAQQGYAEAAFGLRIRVPLLEQVVYGTSSMPREAAAEARTLGNAISGQSYGLLNNRAAVAFWQKVWESKHRHSILPVALIHDAIYMLIKDDVEVVEWANRELINAMRWQELPEIQHPTVKLGAQLDVFWPNWSNAITLPNDITRQEIIDICEKAKLKVAEPA
ncbi:MAG: dnap [uncultured bacterium]|nr:MAG: dnap [uncultured bacterium]